MNADFLADFPCESRTVHLLQGDGLITDADVRLTTVLGSCVAATFHWEAERLGGAFHALLPHAQEMQGLGARDAKPGGGDAEDGEPPCRYVDLSISRMFAAFRELGARPRDLEVRVFGGADVLPAGGGGFSVGARNARAALSALAGSGCRLTVVDVGGGRGRKLVFAPSGGATWVRRLSRPSPPPIRLRPVERFGFSPAPLTGHA